MKWLVACSAPSAFTWINVDSLSIAPLGTKFSEMWTTIIKLTLMEIISSGKCASFYSGFHLLKKLISIRLAMYAENRSLVRVKTFRVTTLMPRKNAFHLADDIFKCIFLNGNFRLYIPLRFVPKHSKGQLINMTALINRCVNSISR